MEANGEATPITEAVNEIAQQIEETDPIALGQIGRIIEVAGEEAARDILAEALKVEAEGGLMIRNESRQRTLGGVFFFLARQHIPHKRHKHIWLRQKQQKAPAFEWADRLKMISKILPKKGEAQTVKITLIGRPGRVVEKGNIVLTSMQSGKPPSLPNALPSPPAKPTTYIIFIAKKQWRKVAEAVKDPEDVLIIEGYPVFDKRLEAMAVFVQNTTTRSLQRAKRQGQR